MKVKIGDKIYDSNEEPIMLILNDDDKFNLASMGEQTKYCSFPEGTDTDKVIEFMKDKPKVNIGVVGHVGIGRSSLADMLIKASRDKL